MVDGIEKVIINLVEEAERTAAQAAAQLRQGFPDQTITASVAHFNPADVLVDQAEKLGVRLTVVGNKRVQGPTKMLVSIARSVAANSSCDVYGANPRVN